MKNRIIDESIESLRREGLRFSVDTLAEVVTFEITDSVWYKILIKLFECFAGVMIGREILLKKIAKSGKQIIGITFVQSIGTFLFVSAVFAVVFCRVPSERSAVRIWAES